jgi:hypothetical protein
MPISQHQSQPSPEAVHRDEADLLLNLIDEYEAEQSAVPHHDMHADTGIGTGKQHKTPPEIGIVGLSRGRAQRTDSVGHGAGACDGGQHGQPLRGMMEIDTEQKTLTAEPDGYTNVMSHKIDSRDADVAGACPLDRRLGRHQHRAAVRGAGVAGKTGVTRAGS